MDVVGEAMEKELMVDETTEILIQVLGNDALSATQLMERLGLSHRPTFQKNYLVPALEAGLIEMTIPDKPNSRNKISKNNLVARNRLSSDQVRVRSKVEIPMIKVETPTPKCPSRLSMIRLPK